jgi:hypothetical protein
MDDRDLARVFGLVRMVVGAVLFLAPARSMKAWTGTMPMSVGARLAARGLGARDFAIGLGTLVAIENEGQVRGWLEAGVVADAADTVSMISSLNALPKPRGLFWLATSGGAALFGAQLATRVDE